MSLLSKALKNVNREEVIGLARDLVKIPSVTGEEGEIAAIIAKKMESIGLSVELCGVDERRPNVIGRMKGRDRQPTLLLNAHMDVVPPGEKTLWKTDPFGGEIMDDRIYGRGAADTKGGLAAMLKAIEVINRLGIELSGDLILEAVVDEERGSSVGTKYLALDKGITADFAIVSNPTNLEAHIAHKGDVGIQISTRGKAVHASVPQLGLNAIHKMVNVMQALLEMPKKFQWDKRCHSLVGPPHLTISVIQGGLQRNIVPDICKIVVDRRIVPRMETIEAAKEEIELTLEELRNKDPKLDVTMETLLEVESMEISEKERIVEQLKTGIKEVLQKTPTVSGLMGFCDAHWLVNNLHIPTAIFGPGRINEAHSTNEYVQIDQLVDATKIYTQTILGLLCQ